MKQRILLMLIALAAMIPSRLSARDFTYTYEGQTIIYTVIDEEARTCATKEGFYDSESKIYVPGNNVSGSLIIPDNPKDGDIEYTFTSLGVEAFCACVELISIDIPASITSITEYDFLGCSSLTSIGIPKSVTLQYSNVNL